MTSKQWNQTAFLFVEHLNAGFFSEEKLCRCSRCGRKLSDYRSQLAGMGKKCFSLSKSELEVA
jgi:hypothetical protein